MVDHIKFTPSVARDWKSVQSAVRGDTYKHCARRVEDASTSSQLKSKLWIIEEVSKLGIEVDRVALLAGWYANFIVPLLFLISPNKDFKKVDLPVPLFPSKPMRSFLLILIEMSSRMFSLEPA